jgi:molybdopterin molybdotransferase
MPHLKDGFNHLQEIVLPEFFRVITPDQMVRLLGNFARLRIESVPIDTALSRILSEDILAEEDLPEQARSTVDGYAVKAEDTFGASDAIPALLNCVASIKMGIMPDSSIKSGQTAQIPTGGFLPQGADAVVMVEYANATGCEIEITRPVTARANILERAEDAKSGECLIQAGKLLRPQEIGFLAAFGIEQVHACKRPKAAVISTGDELVPIDKKPKPGQIRDANGHSLSALITSCGGESLSFNIVPDNTEKLYAALENALAQADLAVISGGSSVGTRDIMVDVVSRLPGVEIMAHGVAIRPGKPTLLANYKGKAVFGLPGHPVSALVVAQVFLAPFLRYLQGAQLEKGPLGHRSQMVLGASIHSTIGLEEYVRMRIENDEPNPNIAFPIFGKSGMLSTMVKADGIIRIPMNVEGFSKGEIVEIIEL